MSRTPQDAFAAHASALTSGDVATILEDYSDDALFLTVDGPLQGKQAIGEFFTAALGALPEAEFRMGSTVFAGDALLLQWGATSPQGKITDAVDTFVFAEGKLRLQTTVFRLETT
jgi:ketosteroid isomerase-like protein